ncbi:MAG: ClpX C4-type zinc finger protein [Actinomycetota bacterium]
MTSRTVTRPAPQCSWCGKNAKTGRYVIAGPDGFDICADCVELCNDILSQALSDWEWQASPDRRDAPGT